MRRAAIVGCGGISAVHAAVLSELPEVQLCACADIRPERAQALAERYGLAAYDSLEAMLREEAIDVLHICTPHALHVPMAEAAAARGIAVFTEKPPAVDRGQWARLLRVSEQVPVGVCFQNRYNAPVQALKARLEADEFGRVLGARAFVTWNRTAPYYTESGWRGRWDSEGGSALINQSIHTLDLLCHLLGTPTQVRSSMQNHHLQGVIETEDTVEARIQFGDRAALFYASTGYCQDAPVFLEVACEKATARIEDGRLRLYRAGGETEDLCFASAEPLGKGYWGNGHVPCIRDFYECLASGRPYRCSPKHVEDTVSLMLAMYDAGRKHLTDEAERLRGV